MTEMFLDEVPYRYLLIRMNDPDDHETIDAMLDDFRDTTKGTSLHAVY